MSRSLDDVLNSSESPLELKDPRALAFLPSTLLEELHVVKARSRTDLMAVLPFTTRRLTDWRDALPAPALRDAHGCLLPSKAHPPPKFLALSMSEGSQELAKRPYRLLQPRHRVLTKTLLHVEDRLQLAGRLVSAFRNVVAVAGERVFAAGSRAEGTRKVGRSGQSP